MISYYHGTNSSDAVINAIIGNGVLRNNFHLTPSLEVARNYGGKIVKVTLENDLTKARIGTINKDGNFNAAVGNGIEVVLAGPAAMVEFYNNVVDAEIIH